jgi:hypothetical protein
MSKVILFSIDREAVKKLNIGLFNPTCKAIIKQLFILSKDEDFEGISGSDLLAKCVENRLWTTTQDPEKYHTTFAYYKKKLMNEAHVIVTNVVTESDDEEYLVDED